MPADWPGKKFVLAGGNTFALIIVADVKTAKIFYGMPECRAICGISLVRAGEPVSARSVSMVKIYAANRAFPARISLIKL